MDLKAKFVLGFALVISLFLVCFSSLLFTQVRRSMLISAQQSLQEHMEHEWKHLQNSGTSPWHPSRTLQNPDIQYRITKNGVPLYDGTLDQSQSLRSVKMRFDRMLGQDRYAFEGRYTLRAQTGFLTTLKRALLIGCIIALGLIVPLSWIFTKWLLSPFRALAQKTRELDVEKLSFRFPAKARKDELGVLLESFNSLLGRLERSFSQVSQFAQNASHELRTPVTVIRGEAEVLLRKPRAVDEYVSAVKRIISQCGVLQGIINQLLFLAQLERMEYEPQNTRIDVKETICGTLRALSLVHSQVDAKKVRTELPDKLVYEGHREMVGSVITNLIDNALKYAKSEVLICAYKDREGLHFKVEDDGPGIAENERDTVFTPFSRLPKQRNSSGKLIKGHGLGLSIVKACIDAAQGKVELGASTWGGLSVSVLLPS